MYVIAGLGNPGKKFQDTKHNIGFTAVEVLAERHGIRVSRLKHKAYVGEGQIAGQKVMLIKPQTFMNESGQSVREVLDYYGVELSELFVIYDDVDIALGSLRIRAQGSAGTHNGMRSIIYQVQDDNFARFRIGIGGERGAIPLRDYVLSGFAGDELEPMRAAVLRCADAVEVAVAEGIETAMLQFNGEGKGQDSGARIQDSGL